MVIATIRKTRPLMKRYPFPSLFPIDDADVDVYGDKDGGTDDDIELEPELELTGTAVFDTITKIKKQIKAIIC